MFLDKDPGPETLSSEQDKCIGERSKRVGLVSLQWEIRVHLFVDLSEVSRLSIILWFPRVFGYASLKLFVSSFVVGFGGLKPDDLVSP